MTSPLGDAFARRIGSATPLPGISLVSVGRMRKCAKLASSKSPLTSSIREQMLTEIGQQASTLSSTFVNHRRKLQDISATSTASTRNNNGNSGMSLEAFRDMAVVHFSSTFDDLPPADNTNINDKFWRAALQYGTLVVGPANVPERPPFWGPFTVPSCLTSSPQEFCVTLTFSSFFVVRYWYESTPPSTGKSASKTTDPVPVPVQFLEFQWILFRWVCGRG